MVLAFFFSAHKKRGHNVKFLDKDIMSPTEKRLTLEQMPEAITELTSKVDKLLELVNVRLNDSTTESTATTWMDLDGLRAYLPDHPTRSTVYSWVYKREIPYYKKSKKLTFSKEEIDRWLLNSAHRTAASMRQDMLDNIGLIKGGKR